MAWPHDEDSGVHARQGVAPRYTGSSYPQWSPGPIAAPPSLQAPPTWSPYGQWSTHAPPPPIHTLGALGAAARGRGRRRVIGLLFLVALGAGAWFGRPYLPWIEAKLPAVFDKLNALKASVRGISGPSSPKTAAAPTAQHRAARGPQIVPLPAASADRASAPSAPEAPAAPARAPVALTAPRPAPALPSVAARPARSAPVHVPAAEARPVVRTPRLALASPPPSAPRSHRSAKGAPVDPFESGAAAAPAPARAVVSAPAPRAERAPERAVERAPEPAAEPPAAKPARGSLDELMAVAVTKGPKRPRSELDRKLAGVGEGRDPSEDAPRKAAPAPAKAQLSRTEIQAVMRDVQGKVGECYRQYHVGGAVEVKISVAESGAVSAVSIGSDHAGTPTGTCVERAVKSATFPPSAGLRFEYRLALR